MFLNTLTNYVAKFDSQESRASTNVPFIQKTWGYPEADIKVRRPVRTFRLHCLMLMISKEWMSTVKYTNDCTTIPSAVLSEVLRYVSAGKPAYQPPTVTIPAVFFQPPGSSLPQTERSKTSKRFLLTQRSLGLLSSTARQYNSSLTAYGGARNSWTRDELFVAGSIRPEGVGPGCLVTAKTLIVVSNTSPAPFSHRTPSAPEFGHSWNSRRESRNAVPHCNPRARTVARATRLQIPVAPSRRFLGNETRIITGEGSVEYLRG